ncbi:MAG: SufS family cysteine desulfurase [Proteobacteria bacterium]|nr:MAG: SufS family cysteine desulfurase [Pseudomonadota bacterium]
MEHAAAGERGPITPAEVQKIRADFPILGRQVRGRDLVYLDNGATTQKPNLVIDAQARVYKELNANVHRGVHFLSQESTDAYEKSRRKIARHLGVKDDAEIIFTRGTTESINLVSQTWGKANVAEGDTVVVTRMEHHSNFVPWQSLCIEKKAHFKIWELNEDLELDLNVLEEILKAGRVKVVAFTAMSNVLGLITPVKEISALAKKYGAMVLVDGAQGLAHLPVNLKEWVDVDFVAFSAHKMCGPTGIGILWGRRKILEAMPPFQFGGDMILQVGDEKTSWNELPWKFEAGTPNYGDSIAFGFALDYLGAIGMDRIAEYETRLVHATRAKLEAIPNVKIIAPRNVALHSGAVSFTTGPVHPHDLATFLDTEGLAIRAGHHCAQPLMRKLGVIATNRASFSFYNTEEEVDFLAASVKKAMAYFS